MLADLFARTSPALRSAGLALLVLPSLACGTVEIPQTLVLEQPSTITIDVPIVDPPNNLHTTNLSGGITTTITADLGFFEILGILVGHALVADVSVDDIAIAGEEIVFLGLLPTGTICVNLDPADPGGGQAFINPLLGVAQFVVDLNMIITVLNEVIAPLLGGPLPFAAMIDSVSPLTLGDLIGLILGDGGGGVNLTQDIQTTLPPDTPIIGGADVFATLTLAQADSIPSNALLDECAAAEAP